MAKKDEDILKQMRDRFGVAAEHESANRENWVKSVDMSSSTDQWPQDVVNFRGAGRPRLTINLLNGSCKQIEGDYRQNELAGNILPASYDADDDIADILGGMCRHIEQASNAKTVYLHGLRYASRGGWGWARVMPEYTNEGTFEQDLRIRAIYNTMTVYCDPKAVMPTREDARYMFVSEMVSKDDHLAEYKGADVRFTHNLEDFDDSFEDWVEEDGERIRRVEYFTKEQVPARFVLFDNGATLEIASDGELQALQSIGWNPVKEKQAKRTQIRWRKCTAGEILEERVYKMPYIPLIPFLGEEINIKGKITLHSAIDYGIDPQLMYNYWKSTATESACLMPKAPLFVTPKQIQNFETQYKNLNTNPQPFVLFNPDPAQPGVPQRIAMPEQPIGEMAMAGGSQRDLQYTTNSFDANLGAPGQEVSGVAIGERQSQGTTGNFLFTDNTKTAIEHIWKVMLAFIPLVYDTERVVRVLNLEGKSSTETINQEIRNPILGTIEILNDITLGEYQVVIEAGKAFATRRREAVEGMIEWSKAFPQQSPMVADLVAENMDIPGGTQIAERVRRSLPPQIVNDPDSPEGQQAQAQAQQQQQAQQQLAQQMMQSKVAVEQGKNQAQMAKAQADVVKAGAEVTKAKADTMQAAIETHQKAAEHVADTLDQARTQSAPVQPVAGTPSAQTPIAQNNTQPTVPAMPSRQSDVAAYKQHQDNVNNLLSAITEHANNTEHQQNIEKLLAGMAQHQQNSDAKQDMHNNLMATMMSHIAEGNKILGHHMAHANAIAQAPVEAIRDKNGKITGRRVRMEQPAA